jgi:tetratricopeptide (TPR) repeat protein
MAKGLNNLAGLYRAQGQYEKAELLHQRALEIREKTLGPEHPILVKGLSNLAGIYSAQAQCEKAEPFHERALSICEKALGANIPAQFR